MRNTGLTEEQIALRDGKLTASRVHALVNGNAEEVMALWEEMVGAREADDLHNHWPAQLGLQTEELNLDWYAKKTGVPVLRRGEVVIGPEEWMACTLDGWDTSLGVPVEAKHCGGYETAETVLSRYQPQLHWTMICTQSSKIVFSVIYGAKEPIVEIIERDDAYADMLVERASRFMKFVWSFTEPVILPAVEAPVLAVNTVDMVTTAKSNQWGEYAGQWLANFESRKKADDAEKELKAMVPKDAQVAHGSGVVITRNRAGSLALRRQEP